ncbi:VanZ family protein [Desulfobulbus propionicus]|jgi:VanZ family protein
MERVNQGLRVLPLLAVMAGIFFLSHQTGAQVVLPDIIQFDKVLHCGMYAVLGGAYLVALPPSWTRQSHWPAGTVVLFCLLYGVSDEYHQSFIPGRLASGGDLAADILGGVVAFLGFLGWRKWAIRSRRRDHEPSEPRQ